MGTRYGITDEQWQTLCETYGDKCLACGRADRPLVRDHIQPPSQGGKNGISNIQPLCHNCNSTKGNRTIDYRSGEPVLMADPRPRHLVTVAGCIAPADRDRLKLQAIQEGRTVGSIVRDAIELYLACQEQSQQL